MGMLDPLANFKLKKSQDNSAAIVAVQPVLVIAAEKRHSSGYTPGIYHMRIYLAAVGGRSTRMPDRLT